MKMEMIMPQMGESIAEATVLKWLKGVGDEVKKDETILEISTDKVDSEIPAPATGTIVELKAKAGDTVPVKSVIAVIETEKGAAAAAPKAEAPKAAAKEAPAAKATPAAKPTPAPAPAMAAPQQSYEAPKASFIPTEVNDRFYSPLVRSLAQQHGISVNELSSISGSGSHGRLTKNDLMAYIEHRGSGPAPSQNYSNGTSSKGARPADIAPATPRPEYGEDGTRVEPFDNMRKLIAEHMVRSKATSAHVYSMAEVDVSNIAKFRERNQGAFNSREGFKLSFTPFFLEAVTRALVQFPQINASIDGDKLILKKNINLGCAVALGTKGLIVPVIRNADQLNLVGLARALTDIATRARTKKLTPDDTQGGTFTVTNPGMFGNIMGCPIINQPQLAILGIGAIKKRVVVVNDAIAIRDIVILTLSYDHRVIDGSLGGQFLQYISQYLEAWDVDQKIY